jgi:hypothetical protein
LLRGSVVLGIVTFDPSESDFPWYAGWLEPSPEYALIEPVFVEMNRLLDSDGLTEQAGKLAEEIMTPGISIRNLADQRLSQVVGINIEGTRVAWRE